MSVVENPFSVLCLRKKYSEKFLRIETFVKDRGIANQGDVDVLP